MAPDGVMSLDVHYQGCDFLDVMLPNSKESDVLF